jgi:CheY-like chemotaxis protein/anti-sigma regulatory factor (Ser/Thr protein kinase)
VNADRTRLKQVLLNLLSNAIKYNRRGGEVRLRHLQAPGERGLEISDTGPGLEPEQQALLFEPFQRLGAEGGTIPGAGIGLALSKRMLEMMHGRIEVDSEPGVGSCFRIWLPGAERAAALPAPRTETPAPQARRTVAQRVLYIEDNPVNVTLMEALMEREPGVQLTCAPLPEVGLALARAEPPDLLLLDLHLPGIDGFEVLRRLRADPVTRQVPVAAVSANAMPADIERARVVGFDDYLTKPIDFDRLRALLQRFGPPAAG